MSLSRGGCLFCVEKIDPKWSWTSAWINLNSWTISLYYMISLHYSVLVLTVQYCLHSIKITDIFIEWRQYGSQQKKKITIEYCQLSLDFENLIMKRNTTMSMRWSHSTNNFNLQTYHKSRSERLSATNKTAWLKPTKQLWKFKKELKHRDNKMVCTASRGERILHLWAAFYNLVHLMKSVCSCNFSYVSMTGDSRIPSVWRKYIKI